MAIVILVIIILALLGVLGYSLRLFRIERIELKSRDAADDAQETEDSPDEEPPEDSETVNLFDYFGENADTAPAQRDDSQPAPSASTAEEGPADYDKLTDLKAGRSFLVDCKRRLERARDEGHMFAAAYFDFDRFNFVNSLRGMFTGDSALTRTAQALPNVFPDGSLITRVSADHFAVVFPLVDNNAFEQYYGELKRFCENLRDDIGVKSGLRLALGFSRTENVETDYDVSILLNKANVARHCHKVSKIEGFEIYDSAMISSFFFGESAMENYSECQYADDFVIYYMPLSDVAAGRIAFYHALARWACEEKEAQPIALDARIPSGNTKVIYQVCRAMSRWRKSGREITPVSVDVPITTLYNEDLDEFILKCLGEFQLEPGMLMLEIDVSVIRTDWSMAFKQLKKLQDVGISAVVGGIDTGYTNFDFLMDLPLSFIRLHRSFAAGAETNDDKLDLCRRAIESASAMNMRVVFEGVDNAERVEALKKAGGRYVQGRYSGRPYNADEIMRSLPEFVEKQKASGDVTVILNERDFKSGDFNAF